MKRFSLYALVFVISAGFSFTVLAQSTPPMASSSSELPSVFSGKDLWGWMIPMDNIWWRAENGVLMVKSGPDQKGSILWTHESYSNFVMQFDFKMGEGTVDSGVFIRDETQQIQIGISGSLKRDMTASPYISGSGYPVEAEGVAELLGVDDWNTMIIVAIGNHYSVALNGHHVMSYVSESTTNRGPIGLQLHGNREMAIDFRDIRIGRLN